MISKIIFAVALLLVLFVQASTAQSLDVNQDSAPGIDIVTLIREMHRNGTLKADDGLNYTWTSRVAYRVYNKRGKAKVEPEKVYEIYPTPSRRYTRKLIMENGAPLTPDEASKEERRVAKDLINFDREDTKKREKRERESAKERDEKAKDEITPPGSAGCAVSGFASEFFGANGESIYFSIPDFLCACEFFDARRVTLDGRETIRLTFRPRALHTPRTKAVSVIANLVGMIWIDARDKQVARLEAWLPTGKDEGQNRHPLSRPAPVLVFDLIRVGEKMWMLKETRVNTTKNSALFNRVSIEFTAIDTNHRRFTSQADDYKVAAPQD